MRRCFSEEVGGGGSIDCLLCCMLGRQAAVVHDALLRFERVDMMTRECVYDKLGSFWDWLPFDSRHPL